MNAPHSSKTPCLFLDRDGVLNRDTGYLWRFEELQWVPGAKDVLRIFNAAGWLVIVITNQSGIARGLFTESDVEALHCAISESLISDGLRIDAFYMCPYHPEAVIKRYRRDSPNRKPNPGMINDAIRDWNVDTTGSFLVGDKDSDVEAAKLAGIRGLLFTGDNLAEFFSTNGLFPKRRGYRVA